MPAQHDQPRHPARTACAPSPSRAGCGCWCCAPGRMDRHRAHPGPRPEPAARLAPSQAPGRGRPARALPRGQLGVLSARPRRPGRAARAQSLPHAAERRSRPRARPAAARGGARERGRSWRRAISRAQGRALGPDPLALRRRGARSRRPCSTCSATQPPQEPARHRHRHRPHPRSCWRRRSASASGSTCRARCSRWRAPISTAPACATARSASATCTSCRCRAARSTPRPSTRCCTTPTIPAPRSPRRRACCGRAGGWWWSISRRTGSSSCASEHAHRRLGFADVEIQEWFAAAGLDLEAPVRLPGDPLTVVIWPARRRGAPRAGSARRPGRQRTARSHEHSAPGPADEPVTAGRSAAGGRALVRVLPAEDPGAAERLWQTVKRLEAAGAALCLGDLRRRRQSRGRHRASWSTPLRHEARPGGGRRI